VKAQAGDIPRPVAEAARQITARHPASDNHETTSGRTPSISRYEVHCNLARIGRLRPLPGDRRAEEMEAAEQVASLVAAVARAVVQEPPTEAGVTVDQ
jgi:hypothetical protein